LPLSVGINLNWSCLLQNNHRMFNSIPVHGDTEIHSTGHFIKFKTFLYTRLSSMLDKFNVQNYHLKGLVHEFKYVDKNRQTLVKIPF
jgi:hypothetical protein